MKNFFAKYHDQLKVIISAILVGWFYPPTESSYIVLFFLIPFISVLNKEGKSGLVNGFIFGFFLSLSSSYWIMSNAGAPVWLRIVSGFGFFSFSGFYYAAMGGVFSLVKKAFPKRAIWLLPLVWGGMEHLMLYKEFAFPWTLLANAFTTKIEFIQIAELFGVIFVSMILVLFSVLIYKISQNLFNPSKDQKEKREVIRKLSVTSFTTIFLFFLIYLWGSSRFEYFSQSEKELPAVKVAMIHAGMDIDYKWQKSNFRKIVRSQYALSDSSLALKPDLILWGETNFPKYLENYPSSLNKFKQYCIEKNVDLSVGALGFNYDPDTEKIEKFNSVFFFSENKEFVRYDKTMLVPFGESFPYSNILTFLKDISLGQANFDRGDNKELFVMKKGNKFVTTVCYEGIFPYYNARYVSMGAEFLTNVSNDAWYENTDEVYQHSRFNIFRSIENRRSVIRLANKAESSIIYPSGKQNILYDNEGEFSRVVDVPVNSELTFFTKNYRVIAGIIIMLNLILIGWSIILIRIKSKKI
ncbi:MAG: apolipoprotein N-acyltransferase [Candidatus Delongbacteria bacterium]|jgi:apolipoprotein N-acyltransferase|nr:apolipoprotein N-acyltransferase [Candidatus Delongbacteria bacterium]